MCPPRCPSVHFACTHTPTRHTSHAHWAPCTSNAVGLLSMLDVETRGSPPLAPPPRVGSLASLTRTTHRRLGGGLRGSCAAAGLCRLHVTSPRLPEITRDYPRLPEIARDYPRAVPSSCDTGARRQLTRMFETTNRSVQITSEANHGQSANKQRIVRVKLLLIRCIIRLIVYPQCM